MKLLATSPYPGREPYSQEESYNCKHLPGERRKVCNIVNALNLECGLARGNGFCLAWIWVLIGKGPGWKPPWTVNEWFKSVCVHWLNNCRITGNKVTGNNWEYVN